MENLSTLAAFVQVAQTRSFSEAGRAVRLSTSGVAKAITRLEAELGTRLFERTSRCVSLTVDGARLLERARRVLAEVGLVEKMLADKRAAPHGRLRVTLPLLGPLFAPAIATFVTLYPYVELDLDFTDRPVDIVEEGYDLAIRTGEGIDSTLMSRRIGSYRLVLVASPDYVRRAGQPAHPSDLDGHACLHRRDPASGRLEGWPLQQDGTPWCSPLPVSASVTSLAPLLEMTVAGCGIACLPDFAVRAALHDGRLLRLLACHTAHESIFRAVWPSSRHIAPRLRVFIDHVATEVFPNPVLD